MKKAFEQCEGKFLLKKSHMHYKQVQGQMVLAGADWCDFIVYSDVGTTILRVALDTSFIHSDLQHLNNFYFNHYLPVLAENTDFQVQINNFLLSIF